MAPGMNFDVDKNVQNDDAQSCMSLLLPLPPPGTSTDHIAHEGARSSCSRKVTPKNRHRPALASQIQPCIVIAEVPLSPAKSAFLVPPEPNPADPASAAPSRYPNIPWSRSRPASPLTTRMIQQESPIRSAIRPITLLPPSLIPTLSDCHPSGPSNGRRDG